MDTLLSLELAVSFIFNIRDGKKKIETFLSVFRSMFKFRLYVRSCTDASTMHHIPKNTRIQLGITTG